MPAIVIATDGSEAAESAARTGFELARLTGDEVILVSVWELLTGSFGSAVPYMDERSLEADKIRGQAVLDAAVKAAAEAGVKAEGQLVQGQPAEEICRIAKERRARMIVVGTHGWGPIRSFLSGSVLAGVLHDAPCPVLAGPRGSREPSDAEE
jgi:nucleotide-binding universal stress UspA family protein